ncbi:MAG: transporter associated domain-containing protein, partial [Lachnospiraceae bacterium]
KEDNIHLEKDGSYSVNPEEHLLDVLNELDIHYPEEQEDEIKNKLMSELTYESLPSIPREGESFSAFDMKITVMKMHKNRIMRLKVENLTPVVEEEGDPS